MSWPVLRMIFKQIALCILCLTPILLVGQYRSRGSISGDYFGASAEVGITSFFGDIDDGPADGSLANNIAYKIQVSRNIKSVLDISGHLSFGNISGEKIRSASYLKFETKFTEYTAVLGINVMSFFKAHRGKFGLYATIGVGLIDFKVKLYDGSNDSLIQSYGYEGQSSTTEFVIPFGGRAIYHISPSSAVSLQTTISYVDTDKLDGKTGNDNTDYYNFLSLGYTYKFGQGGSSGGRGRPSGLRGGGSKRGKYKRPKSRSRYRR